MPKFDAAYTVILGNRPGERIGLVKYNETGYYPCPGWDAPSMTLEEVKEHVAGLNERLGIPANVAESMTYASLFGWHAPCAAPAHAYFNPDLHPTPGR